eukprot:CAMPEP_0178993834 /NCGR_PEP_ID=MMETSP0795-20121207/6932_1 /TAXON_ID=88552 /ORGANISM="Amoebophrya sp., Strain Ameob2" /LENGTH=739 /DNA_ID=CAMNT_0020685955 /DNA_START=467 /DNA_END=2686 /DNA_ORIENTATION=+
MAAAFPAPPPPPPPPPPAAPTTGASATVPSTNPNNGQLPWTVVNDARFVARVQAATAVSEHGGNQSRVLSISDMDSFALCFSDSERAASEDLLSEYSPPSSLGKRGSGRNGSVAGGDNQLQPGGAGDQPRKEKVTPEPGMIVCIRGLKKVAWLNGELAKVLSVEGHNCKIFFLRQELAKQTDNQPHYIDLRNVEPIGAGGGGEGGDSFTSYVTRFVAGRLFGLNRTQSEDQVAGREVEKDGTNVSAVSSGLSSWNDLGRTRTRGTSRTPSERSPLRNAHTGALASDSKQKHAFATEVASKTIAEEASGATATPRVETEKTSTKEAGVEAGVKAAPGVEAAPRSQAADTGDAREDPGKPQLTVPASVSNEKSPSKTASLSAHYVFSDAPPLEEKSPQVVPPSAVSSSKTSASQFDDPPLHQMTATASTSATSGKISAPTAKKMLTPVTAKAKEAAARIQQQKQLDISLNKNNKKEAGIAGVQPQQATPKATPQTDHADALGTVVASVSSFFSTLVNTITEPEEDRIASGKTTGGGAPPGGSSSGGGAKSRAAAPTALGAGVPASGRKSANFKPAARSSSAQGVVASRSARGSAADAGGEIFTGEDVVTKTSSSAGTKSETTANAEGNKSSHAGAEGERTAEGEREKRKAGTSTTATADSTDTTSTATGVVAKGDEGDVEKSKKQKAPARMCTIVGLRKIPALNGERAKILKEKDDLHYEISVKNFVAIVQKKNVILDIHS